MIDRLSGSVVVLFVNVDRISDRPAKPIENVRIQRLTLSNEIPGWFDEADRAGQCVVKRPVEDEGLGSVSKYDQVPCISIIMGKVPGDRVAPQCSQG